MRITSSIKCNCRSEFVLKIALMAGSFEHNGHDQIKRHGASLGDTSLRFIPQEL